MAKRRVVPPQIADAEVDDFIAKFLPKNPNLAAEKRAEVVYKLALDYQPFVEREKSLAWVKEFARRVRTRALWSKPAS